MRGRDVAVGAGAAGVLAYSWWATGLVSFTAAAYVAVAIPVGGLVVAAFLVARPPARHHHVDDRAADGGRRARWAGAAPWVVLLLFSVGLEAFALALGGRSEAVPTISTMVDRALAWHGTRFVLFLSWLWVGWAPVLRTVGPLRREATR